MKPLWVLGLVGAYGFGLAGCVNSVSRVGPRQPARPPDCDFSVLTVPPAEGYAEIGAIDIDTNTLGLTTVERLKSNIHSDVCRIGGDAVIALANGRGEYIKVTVLKATAGASAQPETAPPLSLNTAPRSASATDVGCSYDTQCKGDRICTDGKCVSPSAAPAPSGATSESAVAPHAP